MTLTLQSPDVTDSPPCYIGPGISVTLHESAVPAAGDYAQVEVTVHTSGGGVYLVGNSGISTNLIAGHFFGCTLLSGAELRGFPVGTPVTLDGWVFHTGGVIYDSVTVSSGLAYDPVGGLWLLMQGRISGSVQDQILKSVQYLYPTTA